jgi:hypothetical protein
MPDTGAPWNIPYVDPTDLVRDYPQASEDLADAIADGLDAAGGLVAVHSVTKTNTFSVSAAERSAHTVTGLTFTNIGMADASNKLVIMVWMGAIASSSNLADVGLRVRRDTVSVLAGDVSAARFVLSSGHYQSGPTQLSTTSSSVIGVISPGVTTAADYDVQVFNQNGSTQTLFVNRTQSDADVTTGRYASTFTLMEVRV